MAIFFICYPKCGTCKKAQKRNACQASRSGSWKRCADRFQWKKMGRKVL